MVTVEELRDFLGADENEENNATIMSMREAALRSLRIGAGKNVEAPENEALVNEALRIMVWLSFYANRSDIKNEGHLKERLVAIEIQLEYGEVGADAGSEQSDASTPA